MPVGARAQQPERTRRIGMLMGLAETDRDGQAFVTAFLQELKKLGWTDGGHFRIDYRWGTGDLSIIRTYAAEFVGLTPDVIVARGVSSSGTSAREPLHSVVIDLKTAKVLDLNVPPSLLARADAVIE